MQLLLVLLFHPGFDLLGTCGVHGPEVMMPRNQSTAAQRARQAGGKYTKTLRAENAIRTPPVLVPITSTWCEPCCDGTPHPGASCKSWSPFEFGQPTVAGEFDVCQAAGLPRSRVWSLGDRFAPNNQHGPNLRAPWFFALLYAMLLDEQPELVPDPRALRAAVELGDMAAVDLLMASLDRAAVRLIGAVHVDQWRDVTQPRIEAFVKRTLSDDGPHARYLNGDIETWDITVREQLHDAVTLAERWQQSFTPTRNWDGYMGREGIIWHEPQKALDSVLLMHTGGHLINSVIEVDDERLRIRAAEWGAEGPPVAYWTEPAEHGRSLYNWARVDADRCPAPPPPPLTAVGEDDAAVAEEKAVRRNRTQAIRCAEICGWEGRRFYRGMPDPCPRCGAGVHVGFSGMQAIRAEADYKRHYLDSRRVTHWVRWDREVTFDH